MNLSRIAVLLGAQVLVGRELEGIEITAACASDLMSDVLCFSRSGSLLLTGLTNPQAVRTAEMSEISAVCFVRGKNPPAETVQLARRSGIPLLVCGASMFEACGRLYEAGLRGCREEG
jgi:hypothetical protein